MPFAVAKHVESETISDLRDSESVGQVHLVGVDQDGDIAHALICQDHVERLGALSDTIGIVAVDNIDESLGVLKVVLPEAAELGLATDIPAVEFEVLILKSLNVEANRWNGVDGLIQLHLV